MLIIEKKIEKKINIDLAVVASQWFEVANYNKDYIEVLVSDISS